MVCFSDVEDLYLVGTDMTRVSTLGDDSGIWPNGTISVDLVAAVGLVVVFALLAVQARVDLSAYANSLSRLD